MKATSRTAVGIPEQLAFVALEDAHRRSSKIVRRTPVLTAGSLGERLGGALMLKAENLQRTGSFKLRGALNKLAGCDSPTGVVAGSAGNHAQSLAYAARKFGAPCEVFMPVDSSVGKLAGVRAFGATVHRQGESVEECVEMARARSEEAGFVFVHPFDDYDVIAGQAGVGIEILEDVPDLKTVVVPIGGGGLASGVGAAFRQQRPEVRVVGVQAERCAPFLDPTGGSAGSIATSPPTIADGIAVKRPGEITRPLLHELVDDLLTVPETAIAEAMALLLERSKLVVEGAGAASLAAVTAGLVELDPESPTVVILSGGNVDTGLLAKIAERQETQQGRRLRLFTLVPDRPGGLADLLDAVATTKANLLAVDHVRDAAGLDVRETGIELTLETRGHDHADAVRNALIKAGYVASDI